MGDNGDVKTRDEMLDLMLNPNLKNRHILKRELIYNHGHDLIEAGHLVGRFAAEMSEGSLIQFTEEDFQE